jgi:hypothetical protein
VADLRRLGYEVEHGGPVDLLVWKPGQRWLLAIEVKNKGGAMTPTQTALLARGFPLAVVRNLEEALRAIDAVEP